MAAITAEAVKSLRERTGAGMMECKKALVEADGDLEAAAEAMRKSGLAKADKKGADRLEQRGAAGRHRREKFQGVETEVAGAHRLRSGGHPGQEGQAAFHRGVEQLAGGAGADPETGAGGAGRLEVAGAGDGAGADHHSRHPRHAADGFERGRGAQRHLEHMEAAGHQRLGERRGRFRIFDHQHRQNRHLAQQRAQRKMRGGGAIVGCQSHVSGLSRISPIGDQSLTAPGQKASPRHAFGLAETCPARAVLQSPFMSLFKDDSGVHPVLARVTERIRERSQVGRAAYLAKIGRARLQKPRRQALACSNFAHGFAACGDGDEKAALKGSAAPNVAIVTAYNDMLSAHQPFADYPAILKEAVRRSGGVAQVAGGVPAMCDGITQGEAGMELSLFSRDTIALATAIALSHDMFDAGLCLGVCDKIVPGLLIGALAFGHLPFLFVPAGPMPSGLPNSEKARVRQLYAEGKVGQQELLEAEAASYHSPGTCTFYGTANSNQMFLEILGVHLPGMSFPNPGTPLRAALTRAAARRATEITALGSDYRPLGEMIDERALVNAIVGLHATGGSTNHPLQLIAIARAAGISIDWTDFDELSAVVPLLTRIYPNGVADVNHFHAAGGMAYLIGQLLDLGLLHPQVTTVAPGDRAAGLRPYRQEAYLDDQGELAYREISASRDENILRPGARPFQEHGGLRLVAGNLGRGVAKISAVKENKRKVVAPALVFERQEDLTRAFKAGELDRDFVAVVRFQGPRANGMPELHKLMPALGVLQDRGFAVALLTDGRLSGASGKVTSAIHVTPEALDGPLALVRSGDLITIDPEEGRLELHVPAAELATRERAQPDLSSFHQGMGRELFATFRRAAGSAEEGATTFGID